MQNTIFWRPRMNFMSWHGVEGPAKDGEEGERQNDRRVGDSEKEGVTLPTTRKEMTARARS